MMTLEEFLHLHQKFILVGGKGGVGKTSVASAIGTRLAKAGRKVLIISTDPAHSLSDSFDLDFSTGEIVRVKQAEGDLYALEIKPDKAGDELSKLLKQPVDTTQFSQMFSMSGLDGMEGFGEDMKQIPPPGMDEALSFAKILEYAESDDYDTVILDTAPTGHTLRLLNMPEFLDSFLGRMLKMKTFISNTMTMLKSMFGSQGEKDRTVEMLEAMKEKIVIARDQLMDPNLTQFIIVTIPTLMGIFESERLNEELQEHKIPNTHIIINQINPNNENCSYCSKRHEEHMKNIEYLKTVFYDKEITKVEEFDREIRGIDVIKDLSDILFKEKK